MGVCLKIKLMDSRCSFRHSVRTALLLKNFDVFFFYFDNLIFEVFRFIDLNVEMTGDFQFMPHGQNRASSFVISWVAFCFRF